MAEHQATPPEAIKGGVIAYLSFDTAAIKAGEFYRKVFAAQEVHLQPADDKGRTMHLHMHINGSSVMMSDCYPEHGHPYVAPAGFNLMLPVADVDAWWQRAVDAGCEGVMKPENMFWGDRYAQARDPFG